MNVLPVLLLAATLAPTANGHADARGLAEFPEAAAFASEMAERHGFDPAEILSQLAAASYEPRVIRLITPGTGPARSWQRYRARFIEPVRVREGLAFWADHRDTLAAAEARYGVPAEVILGILGVETAYGRNTGSFPVLGALATLAFDYPPRAELFRRELESLFILARDSGRRADSYHGSYAGAIGYPQFLPSSQLNYAVDFDGDGRIDLEGSPADAIGSIARYLSEHGWIAGQRIADPVTPSGAGLDALIDAGIEPALDRNRLAEAGLELPAGIDRATLIDLPTPGRDTEYWLGYRNFYVITRYNRSSFYAMSVFQLAQALGEARAGAAARADAGAAR